MHIATSASLDAKQACKASVTWYNGKEAFRYEELDRKREALQERWRNHVILRSSIIYGAQCSTPVSRMLFLQFIVSSLEAGKPTAFFDDEFRSPIYVQVISATAHLHIAGRTVDLH